MAEQIGIVKRFDFPIEERSLADNLSQLFVQLEREAAPLTPDSHLEVRMVVQPGAVLEHEPFIQAVKQQLKTDPQLFPGQFIGLHTRDGHAVATFVRIR